MNNCVFDGTSPSVLDMLQEIRDEVELWCLTGASGLRALALIVVSSIRGVLLFSMDVFLYEVF
jgi:hypothetical protein